MRVHQAITNERPGRDGRLRRQLNVDEVYCGLHRLRRQWHLHIAFYKMVSKWNVRSVMDDAKDQATYHGTAIHLLSLPMLVSPLGLNFIWH